MNQYRKEYNKVYNKINKIAQKGSDYVFDYYNLIEEIISNGQYSILEDVMISKYKIVIKNFLSIDDFKKFSFPEIRKQTNYLSSISIQKVLDQKSTYLIGFHLFDKNNNHYLGDIKEIENILDSKYTNKNLTTISIDVQAEVGLNSSIQSTIPQFENNPILTKKYTIGDHLLYTGNIYECIESYTYSSNNRITPTFSSYWSQIKAPTYSMTTFTSSNTLPEKYSLAIDYLKTFTYSYI